MQGLFCRCEEPEGDEAISIKQFCRPLWGVGRLRLSFKAVESPDWINATTRVLFCILAKNLMRFLVEGAKLQWCNTMEAEMATEKNDIMSFWRYGNLKNCFVNDEWLKRDHVVSHYMPYFRFKEAVQKPKPYLLFISPEKWDDPFEKIYLHTHFSGFPGHKLYEPPKLYCLCFTKQKVKNSDAFWKCFKSDTNQQLVRVEFSLSALIKQICSLAKDFNVYVSLVDYRLQRDVIKNYSDFVVNVVDEIDEKTNLEELYIKMLSYKRSVYDYEQELRIFLVPKENKHNIKDEHYYKIENFDYASVVKKVWLEPFPSGWVTKKKMQEDLICLSDRIVQSSIYKNQKPCDEIKYSGLNFQKKEIHHA